jgi:hypothetical protein
MLQWNGYEPGSVGAVKVLFPAGAASSNALPASAVTVCAVPSSFRTVMVAPGLTGSGVVNRKSLIVMVEAALPASEEDGPADGDEPDVAPADEGEDGEPDEPQAARATVHRPARASRAGAWLPDMVRSHRAS